MDETAQKDQVQQDSNEEGHPQRTRNSESNNKPKINRSKIRVTSQQRQSRYSHSRSSSPHNVKNNRQWISSNAFVNFIQDFRQNFAGVRSTRIYQMAGKTWRKMSPEQRQPYLRAALSIKNKKHVQQKVENMQKPDTNTKENAKDTDMDKQEKVSRKERKKRKPNVSTKKKSKSDSDCDSMTSGTTGSNTTDDFSDDSS